MYMTCVSRLPRPDIAAGREEARRGYGQKPDFANHPVTPLIWAQDNGMGRKFINLAARRLPELAICLSSNPIVASEESIDELRQFAISSIETVCLCPYHLPNGKEVTEGDGKVCLRIVLEIMTIFLWILVNYDIDENTPPSVTCLINLYVWQPYANKSSGTVPGKFYELIMSCDFQFLALLPNMNRYPPLIIWRRWGTEFVSTITLSKIQTYLSSLSLDYALLRDMSVIPVFSSRSSVD